MQFDGSTNYQEVIPMFVSEERRELERRRTYRIAALIATGLASVASVVQAPVAGASDSAANRTPAVAILPFGGDVFTTAQNGVLIAVDPRSTPASAPLFNFAGNPLGLTWGQFSSATASSGAKTVTRKGIDYTDVRISMTGLIPGGVYSLFYETFSPNSANPACPTTEPLVALPARFPTRQSPDPDSFVADGTGAATFHARVAGSLLDAQQFNIVLIYHFDGKTYGPVLNMRESQDCHSSFGLDAMRQFIIVQKSS